MISGRRFVRAVSVLVVLSVATQPGATARAASQPAAAKAAPQSPTTGAALLSPERFAAIKWMAFSDPSLDVRGLPWLKGNAPDLWRLPKRAKEKMPKAVWNRALVPDGGRIRLSCNTSQLGIRVQIPGEHKSPCFLDAYVNGQLAGSADATATGTLELALFDRKDRSPKDITIYLPCNHQALVLAVGIDADAEMKTPPPFAVDKPMVCYGSSVLQGSGATHPAFTYPAVVARLLNLDFVNLGFGGAGKAEPEVVSLVNEIDGCCYLFDLGKSYGLQPMEPYVKMLGAVRASHPAAPIFCVTPIDSTKEAAEAEYHKKSVALRDLMRQAAIDRIKAGDRLMFVIEGLELFGEADKDVLHDALHPNDQGNERMAKRLAPTVERFVLGKETAVGK